MASSFMGLYVQRDALMVAQKSLDIVGNNLTNVQTKGYSRQRVDVASISNHKNNLGYVSSTGLAGQGINAVGVAQIRDALLDKKVRNYASDVSNVGVKVSVLSDVENALDNIESEDSGFNAVLSKFKSTLQGFSADNANRKELASITQYAAKSVVEYLNTYSSRLDDISDQVLNDTKSVTKRVNSILAQLGDLNKQITDSYVSMNNFAMTATGYQVQNSYGPLELKDQANMLIDELSEYIAIDFKEESNGSFTVSLTGHDHPLVENQNYAQMTMINLGEGNATDDPKPQDMGFVVSDFLLNTEKWKEYSNTEEQKRDFLLSQYDNGSCSNITADRCITGGSLRGYLDMYNGNGMFDFRENSYEESRNLYKGIEYYKNMLNSFATTFAREFNAVFSDFDFGLFTFEDGAGGAAESLRISEEWLNNPELISKPYLSDASSADDAASNIELDNTYIMKMLGVFEKAHTYGDEEYTIPQTYKFEKFSQHICEELGTQVEYESGIKDTSEIMFRSVETARDEVMGVSIEEEGVSMLTYQKWYNAIARMTTTLDEALEKLINGTGRVGL